MENRNSLDYLNPSIEIEPLLFPIQDVRRKKLAKAITYFNIRCLVLFVKMIFDTFNFISCVILTLHYVSSNCKLLITMYFINDIWMVFLNLQLREGYVLNRMSANNILLRDIPNFYQKSLIQQGLAELSKFHSSHLILVTSTYLHVLYAFFILIFTYVNFDDEYFQSHLVYASLILFLIGASLQIGLPIVSFIIFYAFVLFYVMARILLDIIFAIISLVFLLIFSPCICLYFKCCGQDEQGQTKYEQQMRESYKQIECLICMEDFKIDDKITQFPCFKTHVVHVHCGDDWLNQKKECPMCRFIVNDQNKVIPINNYDLIEVQNNLPALTTSQLFWAYFKKKLKRRFYRLWSDSLKLRTLHYNLFLHILIIIHYSANV